MRDKVARLVAAIAGAGAMLFSASPAQAAPADPLFVFTPSPPPSASVPVPPPTGSLNGPCGMGVDSIGTFYVSDYYHDAIDIYYQNADYNDPKATGATGYLGQFPGPFFDSLEGLCAIAFGSSSSLYINQYHRAVIRLDTSFFPFTKTTITGAEVDGTYPTGVDVDPVTGDVYVDQRTYVAVFDSSGAPVMTGPPGSEEPIHIGEGSLQDGYSLARSSYPGTAGYLYVPDAATNTVKVYDPATDKENPIEEIDGAETPNGEFVSLRDAAVAVDRVTGQIYVADNLQPKDTERPQAVIYVFDASGAYEGHLKFLIRDALPPGLAVDNSETPTQGRVYVTSGNTVPGTIYAYGPGAATTSAVKLSTAMLALTSGGTGDGAITTSLGERCSASCAEEVPGGGTVHLNAEPAPGSAFAGWSGACSGTEPTCAVDVEEGASVRGSFAKVAAPPAPDDPSTAKANASQTQIAGTLVSSVNAKLAPKKLPREDKAPVSVSIDWKVSTSDGAEPPTLKKLAIEINRNGILDPTGLPTCPIAKIQPASTQRALSNCRSSLVGKGSFSALAGLEGQERYVAKGKMILFNAKQGGKPVLFGQIYSAYPFANSFVIVFEVEKAKKGAYGTTLTATLPANLRAWGNLTEINMRLARNYSYMGEKRSFLSAGCPAPKGFTKAVFRLARTSFAFDSGQKITSTITSDCTARG